MIDQIIENIVINPDNAFKLATTPPSSRRVIFIDCTFLLPGSKANAYENYAHEHIEKSKFFDIEKVSDSTNPLPHMLPDKECFESALSKTGIHNNDILILYGQNGMIMGPCRVWWMFKGFGHQDVMILNGGLPAWRTANLPTVNTPSSLNSISEYNVQSFNAKFVVNLQDVNSVSENKSGVIIDARPHARFLGSAPEPREGMRCGHIPNSINIPCSLLVDAHGMLKSKNELASLFTPLNLSAKGDKIITTCGSGITACALFLALHFLEYTNISVYDGSWSEWGHERSPTKVVAST
ncbi:MAG: sulfurtransferase [Alphaproteobacteria bacterium]